MKRTIVMMAMILTLGPAFYSCRDTRDNDDNETEMNDNMDAAGNDIEDAAQETGDAIDNAAEETGDAVDNAADEVHDEVDGNPNTD